MSLHLCRANGVRGADSHVFIHSLFNLTVFHFFLFGRLSRTEIMPTNRRNYCSMNFSFAFLARPSSLSPPFAGNRFFSLGRSRIAPTVVHTSGNGRVRARLGFFASLNLNGCGPFCSVGRDVNGVCADLRAARPAPLRQILA